MQQERVSEVAGDSQRVSEVSDRGSRTAEKASEAAGRLMKETAKNERKEQSVSLHVMVPQVIMPYGAVAKKLKIKDISAKTWYRAHL